MNPLSGVQGDGTEIAFTLALECAADVNDPQAAVTDVLWETVREIESSPRGAALADKLEFARRDFQGIRSPAILELMLAKTPSLLAGASGIALFDLERELRVLKARQAFGMVKIAESRLFANPQNVALLWQPLALAPLAGRNRQARLRRAQGTQSQDKVAATETRGGPLPQLRPKDVTFVRPRLNVLTQGAVVRVDVGTQGIVAAGVAAPLPIASAATGETELFRRIVMQVMQEASAAAVTLNSQLAIRAGWASGITAMLSFEGRALCRSNALMDALEAAVARTQTKTLSRLRERVDAIVRDDLAGIGRAGHWYALKNAAASTGTASAAIERQSGLTAIARWQSQNHEEEGGWASQLAEVFSGLRAATWKGYVVANPADAPSVVERLSAHLPTPSEASNEPTIPRMPPFATAGVVSAWTLDSPVAFNATCYPAVHADHVDAPVLAVLAPLITSEYLLPRVRAEGGAYGTAARYDIHTASFGFFSFRDPRSAETLNIFENALDWITRARLEPHRDGAVLGALKMLGRGASDGEHAIASAQDHWHGWPLSAMKTLRERILAVSTADLERVAARYLNAAQARHCVIAHPSSLTLLLSQRTVTVLPLG